MAKDDTNGNGAEETRGPTKRVVLRREDVIVLTDLSPEHREAVLGAVAAVKVRGIPKGVAAAQTTWAVVGEFEGASKTKAIEAHAGKAGTPDAKVGAYKAPTVSAWSGGELYEAPPEPLVARRALED